MIVASQIEIDPRRPRMLDNASATIHPGHQGGSGGQNGCGKSTFFALVRGELAIDNGSFSLPARLARSQASPETQALGAPPGYVIDGDKGFRALEAKLAKAEQDDNGLLVAELHGRRRHHRRLSFARAP